MKVTKNKLETRNYCYSITWLIYGSHVLHRWHNQQNHMANFFSLCFLLRLIFYLLWFAAYNKDVYMMYCMVIFIDNLDFVERLGSDI